MGSKKRLAALLLCLFLLAGCQGKALPSGMGEEALLSGGREVLLLVVTAQARQNLRSGGR